MSTNKIKVTIVNQQNKVKIPTGLKLLIRRTCNAVLRLENFKYSAELSCVLVDNETIKDMNMRFRNVNNDTDVLSFPLFDKDSYSIDPQTNVCNLGDVVLSLEKAVEQAEKYGHTLQREVAYLISHGVFHLLGYDHEQGGIEEALMREKQEEVMASLGLSIVMGDRH